MTDADRWAAVKALVGQALELGHAQRAAWLCAQDVPDDVRAEAQALVDADARAGGFLDEAAIASPGAAAALFEATHAPGIPRVASGQVVGAYRILRLLGEGGMATVYLAERADEAFRMQVAIKFVRTGGDGAVLAERLQQERRLLATLDHPNIARLIDGGATGEGVPYVVMEFVDGVPIDVYCRARAASPAAAVALVRRICDAVHHAHRNLVVHRDIKVSNILVTADGTPKLVDFGIAKALGAGHHAQTLTAYGAMTPESASPEQVSGGPVTVATDVYGLGALLYRLLTGRGPFAHATSAAELLRAVCDLDPEPPSRVAPGRGIPRDIDLVVLRALRKRPDDRYDSAAALAADLDRFLEGRPVAAAPASVAYRVWRFVARHRLAAAAALVAVVVLTAAVAAIAWQGRVADRERARAERRFDDLRRLANTLIFEIHDAVVPLPGSTPVRRTLVERALTYLDTLSKDAGNDVSLKRELASAYLRLATVQGMAGVANLGDTPGARASLEKALALRHEIAQVPTATPADIIALAEVHEGRARLADVPRDRLAHAAEGLRILGTLPEADASSSQAVVIRAALTWSDATTRAEMQDVPGSVAGYTEAVRLFDQVLRAAPPDGWSNASRNLGLGLKNLGAALWVSGDRARAVDAYTRAVALDEARLATQPDNTTWMLDVSFGIASLAHAEMNMGDTAASLAHYERSLALRQRALAGDPQNAQARGAVERAHRTLARVLAVRGDVSRALESLRLAAAVGAEASPGRSPAREARAEIDALTAEMHVRLDLIPHDPARRAAHAQAACLALDRIADLQRAEVARGVTPPPGPGAADVADHRRRCLAASPPP